MKALPSSCISLMTPEFQLFHLYAILGNTGNCYTHEVHSSCVLHAQEKLKLIACWMEVDQWINLPPVEFFLEIVYIYLWLCCKVVWLFELECMCASFHCCIDIYTKRLFFCFFCFELELLNIGSLVTSEDQKKASSWHSILLPHILPLFMMW